jgi:hypothetical protein
MKYALAVEKYRNFREAAPRLVIQFRLSRRKNWTNGFKVHKAWGHDDWLKLFDDLNAKGFGNLVSDQVGQDSVDCTSRPAAKTK